MSLIDFERQAADRLPRQKQIFDLRRMEILLEQLGNPHYSPVTIHVAGTKGKGSSAAYCDSVLTTAGFKTSDPNVTVTADDSTTEEEDF